MWAGVFFFWGGQYRDMTSGVCQRQKLLSPPEECETKTCCKDFTESDLSHLGLFR